MAEEYDIIHPVHYSYAGDYEHFKVGIDWKLGGLLYSATRYLCRAGRKPGTNTVKELGKAVWYLEKQTLLMKNGEGFGLPVSCRKLDPSDVCTAWQLPLELALAMMKIAYCYRPDDFGMLEDAVRYINKYVGAISEK